MAAREKHHSNIVIMNWTCIENLLMQLQRMSSSINSDSNNNSNNNNSNNNNSNNNNSNNYNSNNNNSNSNIDDLLTHMLTLQKLQSTKLNGCFEWIDGQLVHALKYGHWLLIDNANLCSPSVLDRLNGLLEKVYIRLYTCILVHAIYIHTHT